MVKKYKNMMQLAVLSILSLGIFKNFLVEAAATGKVMSFAKNPSVAEFKARFRKSVENLYRSELMIMLKIKEKAYEQLISKKSPSREDEEIIAAYEDEMTILKSLIEAKKASERVVAFKKRVANLHTPELIMMLKVKEVKCEDEMKILKSLIEAKKAEKAVVEFKAQFRERVENLYNAELVTMLKDKEKAYEQLISKKPLSREDEEIIAKYEDEMTILKRLIAVKKAVQAIEAKKSAQAVAEFKAQFRKRYENLSKAELMIMLKDKQKAYEQLISKKPLSREDEEIIAEYEDEITILKSLIEAKESTERVAEFKVEFKKRVENLYKAELIAMLKVKEGLYKQLIGKKSPSREDEEIIAQYEDEMAILENLIAAKEKAQVMEVKKSAKAVADFKAQFKKRVENLYKSELMIMLKAKEMVYKQLIGKKSPSREDEQIIAEYEDEMTILKNLIADKEALEKKPATAGTVKKRVN